MGSYGGQLLLVFVLILVNAAFSGSEMALVSLRDGQIRQLEQDSARGRVLGRLTRDPNRFLATIQIGITTAGFLASAFAATSLAQPLVGPLGFLGPAAELVAIILITIVLTFVTLVLGELAPKRLAMQRAEGWSVLVARPLDGLSAAARPVVWLLGASTDLVVRLFGGDPRSGREEVSVEEIRDLVTAQRQFTPEQKTIISGAFEITDRTVREIVVPRRDVIHLPAMTPTGDGLRLLAESGHSRAPVTGPSGLDEVMGVVHLRDLLSRTGAVGDHAHAAVFFPETLTVVHALRQMRDQRAQFAFVVDEHGAIDGIVTMEDLIEEIVGEIYDETDRDLAAVISEPDGAMLLPGTFPIHDLPDLGIDPAPYEDANYTTIAGLILARLGHIPTAPGETTLIDGLRLEITDIQRRAITQVRLRRTSQHH